MCSLRTIRVCQRLRKSRIRDCLFHKTSVHSSLTPDRVVTSTTLLLQGYYVVKVAAKAVILQFSGQKLCASKPKAPVFITVDDDRDHDILW